MDHATIIARLGGYEHVAAALHRHRSRVHRWQTDGIPVACWPGIITLAAGKGLSVSADDLLRHAPQTAVAVSAPSTDEGASDTANGRRR